MIEFNQPIQCLLCPQRRRIAMMFKILLAASTAIIVGLILFSSGPGSDKVPPVTSLPNNRSSNQPRDARVSGQSAAKDSLDEEDEKIDPQSDQQIRSKADEEYQAVQSQLKSILDSEPVHLSEARKLLQTQRRKILLNKITLLGKNSIGGKAPRSPEDSLRLQLQEKELKLISQQVDLLARADGKE